MLGFGFVGGLINWLKASGTLQKKRRDWEQELEADVTLEISPKLWQVQGKVHD